MVILQQAGASKVGFLPIRRRAQARHDSEATGASAAACGGLRMLLSILIHAGIAARRGAGAGGRMRAPVRAPQHARDRGHGGGCERGAVRQRAPPRRRLQPAADADPQRRLTQRRSAAAPEAARTAEAEGRAAARTARREREQKAGGEQRRQRRLEEKQQAEREAKARAEDERPSGAGERIARRSERGASGESGAAGAAGGRGACRCRAREHRAQAELAGADPRRITRAWMTPAQRACRDRTARCE